MKKSLFFGILLYSLLRTGVSEAVTYYTRVTGNWNALTTWSTVGCGGAMAAGLPSAGDDIIVCVGTTVTVNINTTIANVTINNGGTLQNGGGSTTNRTLTVTGTLNVGSGGTLIQNSILPASSSLFAGTEIFNIGSTVTISNWSSISNPLITNVSSPFSHLNLNWNSGVNWWNNQGLGVTKTIGGNLTVGVSCKTFLDSSAANLNIPIGGHLTVNGNLRIKNAMPGSVILNVAGNVIIGGAGLFAGIYSGSGSFNISVVNMTTTSGGTFNGIQDGIGNATIGINGTFLCGGNFYGINAPFLLNNGVPSITINSLSYSGGTFMAAYAHNLNGTATVNILTNANVSFTIASDKINLLGLPNIGASPVTTKLNFTVGGNLSVGGLSTCSFNTSETSGEENISIGGTFTVTAAKTLFNGSQLESNGHKVKASIGAFTMSGGTVWFSENASDSTLITVAGHLTLSGGTLILKSSAGYALLTVNGNFTQNLVGTLFYMHGSDQLGAAIASNNFVDMRVNGSFTQSGGVLHFDSADSPAEQRLFINGSSYTISNSATMFRAGSGTSSYFARILFEYAGTTTYFRNLAHNIQQCKQSIKNGCTVQVTSGPFQISSHNTPILDLLTIESGGTLSMGANQLTSDTLFSYSGITLNDNARLRFSRTNGLYDGTRNAVISSARNMNYFLGTNSIVEYNTTTFARVTGINVGVATLPQHKYGILEINHIGPAGTWVAPTYLPTFTTAVYIRTRLIMTAGEFNLSDAAGNPVNGGRYVYIENPSPTALIRNGGYIRSEALDHSARIIWTMNGSTGNYLIPWGYSAAEYIPLTYQLTGGNAGTVSFSTYRTPSTNLPWPAGVTNLTSHIGLLPDNRTATVDRFWRLANTGGNPVLNLTFNYAAVELPGIPYNSPALIRGYAYNSTSNTWMAALPGQTALAYQVTVPGAGGQTHWALASLNSPLPVEWLFFTASPETDFVRLNWATLSERDNSHFVVERSVDLVNVERIGNIAAAGNSNSPVLYEYDDYKPLSKLSYYRLKQVDNNGSENFTEWVSVHFMSSEETEINIRPNPVSDVLYLQIPEEEMRVAVFDYSGKLVLQSVLTGGEKLLRTEHLKPGIYSLLCTSNSGENKVLKFLKND